MEEEALDRTWWRTRFGNGYICVVRQSKEWMHEIVSLSAAKKPLFVFAIVSIEFCCASLLSAARLSVVCISVSQPPGRGPVPGPGINYTGAREA